jgi:hypothetical protein
MPLVIVWRSWVGREIIWFIALGLLFAKSVCAEVSKQIDMLCVFLFLQINLCACVITCLGCI